MNREERIGNIQTIGYSMYQSSYFMTSWIKSGLLAVLADGKIDSINAMRASVICCEITCKAFADGKTLEECQRICSKVIKERIFWGRMPNVSLLTVFKEENTIQFCQIGDNALFQHQKTGIIKIIDKAGVIPVENGMSFLLCTPGVHITLNETSLCNVMEQELSNQEKAEEILARIQKAGRSDQENVALVILG